MPQGNKSPNLTAVVPAAGTGGRLSKTKNKLLLPLCGRPILWHTLTALHKSPLIQQFVVVVNESDRPELTNLLTAFPKITAIVNGGRRRQESVYKGLKKVSLNSQYVLIHDGARPFVSNALLERCIQAAHQTDAAIAALPVTDTIKKSLDSHLISESLDRSLLWRAQTPQVFRRELIIQAHERALKEEFEATDDATLVERLGAPVALVPGEETNIKITTEADLKIAESIAANRTLNRRVGIGYDVHPLKNNHPLVLGGVTIDFPLGLSGHSDADVLTHAICDALLGAASIGDLGSLFPDTDEKYRQIRSLTLLQKVSQMLREQGYKILSIDATVVAEAPKLAPYIKRMRENLSQATDAPIECISVKATTTEGLGFAGRKEGIAAYSVALIEG